MKQFNTQPRAVLLDTIDQEAQNQFEQQGFHVSTFREDITPDNLTDLCSDAHVLGIRSGPKLPETTIAHMEDIVAIGCYCVGTDHVDHKAAAEQGIAVFNSPYDNGRSVAELVMGQTINLLRKMTEHNNRLHNREWLKTAKASHELRDKTIGIIGYGNIGKQVGILAEALGMRVLYYDSTDQTRLGGAQSVDKQTLLQKADIVTLHTPGGQTRPVIGAHELAHMKPGSYLINAARGDAVDYGALHLALANGQIAGTAIDVYPDEPKGKHATFDSPLAGQENVLLTPHIGGSTIEAQAAIGRTVTSKLIDFCFHGTTAGAVNVPGIVEPQPAHTRRLTYLHHNQPGATAAITALISEHGNIVESVLKTKSEIGYALYDIEHLTGAPQLEVAINSLNASIRSRLL